MAIRHNGHRAIPEIIAHLELGYKDMVKQTVVDVAYTAMVNLQVRSPIDTGYYMSNHFLTLDTPSNEVWDKVKDLHYDREANKALNDAATQLMSFDPKRNKSIHIVNNVPYAGRIEMGWSDQAPQGVYAIVRQLAQKHLERLSRKR